MTLYLKKCECFTNLIDYLGHKIRPGLLEVSTGTIDALRQLKYKATVTYFQSFLWLSSVSLRFPPNFACVTALSNKVLRKCRQQTFDRLSDQKIAALETLKAKLLEP